VNGLSGDTYVFAEIDGKYGVYMLKELYELHNQGHKIKVPSLLNERGEKGWVEVENIVSYGNQSLKRITLSSSRLFVEVSEDAIIPAFTSHLFSGTEEQIKMNFKRVNELKILQDPRHNDTLLLTIHIPLNIPEGDQTDWEYGFALGYWVAEGSIKKRKHSFTKYSLAKLNSLARKKGMTLEAYLEFMTDIERVQLTVGESDFERGHVDIVQKHFKFTEPYKQKHANAYQLYSSDLSFIRLIKDYTEGQTSHDKCVKNDAYNSSWKFLEGTMEGFLSGDGTFSKNMDLFQVNITTNYRLYNDLIFLSKALGYDLHLQNGRFVKSPSSNNYYYQLCFSISKNWHRHVALGLIRERIKKIEDVGKKEAFNLVVKPLYSDNKRSIFNNLYFTAYGFLVSDAVKAEEPKRFASGT